ncbi:chemotaxis protein CheW [Starkeya koreensis]|uniref:Chemotaxis protein CheW n=1 Tax=Ancylobacter koreensis TaxID=266121 RepID=A0ABT0DQW4_9HYPH|nr:chemotaxis protein CheW [Ancylobacter koreensis]MCK0209665.1 chemotaxis protein CheW [Ancylobacter koreensis]
MLPVDSLSAAPRGTVSGEASRTGAFRPQDGVRPEAPRGEARPAPARVEVLSFSLYGMRFALPAAQVLDVMTVAGERWQKLLAMATNGTLGSSGLPLIRLSSRMGLVPAPSAEGGLALFGTGGKVRAAVLIDEVPTRQRAAVESMPASWRDRFSPCEDMIAGVALMADGLQAAMLDLPLGVVAPRPRTGVAPEHDTAHLLVRAGRAQLEAVRVATLRGATPLDEMPGIAVLPSPRRGRRMMLEFGGEGDVIAVDEVVGLAPAGRIERVGSLRFLATATGRYRLLEPGGTQPGRTRPMRVLVTAPDGAARTGLRDLVRSMGHDVSLADDPRAARLAGGRFDTVLFDLDAYADVRAEGVATPDGARRIGLCAGAQPRAPRGFDGVVPAGDPVALVLALLRRPGRAG